ncbi:hypothetical protein, partial [Micrococcus sp. GbtcB5]|uniref:helix-hairpin-helix domain-containing protein n=1 Tax=Micrococcus sp. GbtcB5 TaxID=2824750 RepID=UPI001C2FAA4E
TVLPPAVTESHLTFTPVGGVFRSGMGAVRIVGANVVKGMVQGREEKGSYAGFGDFLAKVPLVVCSKRTIESMIKAGAFDSLGY